MLSVCYKQTQNNNLLVIRHQITTQIYWFIQRSYHSTNSAPTISWMWYFIWNLTSEVVRRSSSSVFRISPYLDFFTMPRTALRPVRKLWSDIVVKAPNVSLVVNTPTLNEVLNEFARVWDWKPPAARIPHSEDAWFHQLTASRKTSLVKVLEKMNNTPAFVSLPLRDLRVRKEELFQHLFFVEAQIGASGN